MGHMWISTLARVIGKRIQGLLVTQSSKSPRYQVFLIFDDGTHYELYGADIQGTKNIYPGGIAEIKKHLREREETELLLEIVAE